VACPSQADDTQILTAWRDHGDVQAPVKKRKHAKPSFAVVAAVILDEQSRISVQLRHALEG